MSGNRRYLLRIWMPALALVAVIGVLLVAALTSGDPARAIPAAIGITFGAVVVIASRWHQKRRLARMLQAPEPEPYIRSIESAAARMPHGSYFAAANGATILALYGRVDEAERKLQSVPWRDLPPFVEAQASAARAVIAYARGSATEGLDHAVVATEQATVDPVVPGAKSSELAFRTYRNLGLALSGRATSTTRDELRTALATLPLLGQILAAWGLAAIARNEGAEADVHAMRS